MKRVLKFVARQSPALVVATGALCLSLGGGVGYAASVMSGRAIAYHSIPGNRIMDHSITSRQLAPNSVVVSRLHLINGWASSNSVYATGNPSVVTNGTGIAHLIGSLHRNSSSNNEFAVLPAGDRPGHNLYLLTYTNSDSTGYLFIGSDGDMYVYGSAAPLYTSLAGISFPIGK